MGSKANDIFETWSRNASLQGASALLEPTARPHGATSPATNGNNRWWWWCCGGGAQWMRRVSAVVGRRWWGVSDAGALVCRRSSFTVLQPLGLVLEISRLLLGDVDQSAGHDDS